MQSILYESSRRAEWDAFVRANPSATHGHLSANFLFAAERYQATNRSLMLYANDNKSLLAVMPLYVTAVQRLRIINMRTLVSGAEFPAGPLFAPGISPKTQREALGALLEAAKACAHKEGADIIAINYPNLIGATTGIALHGYYPPKEYGYLEQFKVYHVIDLRQSEDVLWKHLDRICHRQINAARQEGAHTHTVSSRDEWLRCDELNKDTLAEANVAYTPRQLEMIWDDFVAPGLATVTAGCVNDTVMSVVVVVHFNGAGYNWIAFNRRSDNHPVGIHRLTLWEAILACKRNNIEAFNVGSRYFSGRKLLGISSFIQSFGGVPTYSLSGYIPLHPRKQGFIDFADIVIDSFRKK